MDCTIRLATVADIPRILEISNDAAMNTAANFAIEPESLASWEASFEVTHERYPWIVAADATDRVVGFAKASPWKGRCAYLDSAEITVYVAPDRHGGGIGKALYGSLLPTMTRQGYQSVLGGITLPNPASVRLHESFGMKRAAVFRGVGWKFGRWHDVGYWQGMLQTVGTPPPDHLQPVAAVFS